MVFVVEFFAYLAALHFPQVVPGVAIAGCFVFARHLVDSLEPCDNAIIVARGVETLMLVAVIVDTRVSRPVGTILVVTVIVEPIRPPAVVAASLPTTRTKIKKQD